jgi:protein-disulfide isomerase
MLKLPTHVVTSYVIPLVITGLSILVLFFHSEFKKNALDKQYYSDLSREATMLVSREPQPFPVYGNAVARTTVVMFSDPACQYCRSLYPKLKGLVDISDGTVNLIYRPAPLIGVRSEAYTLTERVGECVARNPVRYHVFLDTLFAALPKQTQLLVIPTSTIVFAAQMNEAELAACLENNDQIEQLISEHHTTAAVLGVKTIPHTFIVTGTKVSNLVGDQRLEVFDALIRDHTTSVTSP